MYALAEEIVGGIVTNNESQNTNDSVDQIEDTRNES